MNLQPTRNREVKTLWRRGEKRGCLEAMRESRGMIRCTAKQGKTVRGWEREYRAQEERLPQGSKDAEGLTTLNSRYHLKQNSARSNGAQRRNQFMTPKANKKRREMKRKGYQMYLKNRG